MAKTIDVECFKDLESAGKVIVESLGKSGFLYLTNHGIDLDLVLVAEKVAFDFYDKLNEDILDKYQVGNCLQGLRVSQVILLLLFVVVSLMRCFSQEQRTT